MYDFIGLLPSDLGSAQWSVILVSVISTTSGIPGASGTSAIINIKCSFDVIIF